MSLPSIHFFACLPPLSPYAPLLVAPSSLCLVFVPCKRAVCGLMRLLLCFYSILALPFPCALSARIPLLLLCCTCVPVGSFRCVFFCFLSRFVSRSSSAFFSRMALSKHSVAHTLGPSYLCVASFSPSFAVSPWGVLLFLIGVFISLSLSVPPWHRFFSPPFVFLLPLSHPQPLALFPVPLPFTPSLPLFLLYSSSLCASSFRSLSLVAFLVWCLCLPHFFSLVPLGSPL